MKTEKEIKDKLADFTGNLFAMKNEEEKLKAETAMKVLRWVLNQK